MSREMRPSPDDEVLTPEERIAFMIERVREAAWSAAYEGRVSSIRAKADHLTALFEAHRRGELDSAPRSTDLAIGEYQMIFFHAEAPKGETRLYEGSPGPLQTESPRRPLRGKPLRGR